MDKLNILGKKAEAKAALKERIIAAISWMFISFCLICVIYFSTLGLKTLFLTSNKHFTLNRLEVEASGLPEGILGLVNPELLKESLELHEHTHNLFDVDLKLIKKKVESNISIDSAEVIYIFPDTIRVTYIEKLPIAKLSSTTLIDKSGFILPNGRFDLQLPQIITKHEFTPGTKLNTEIADEQEKLKNKEILDAVAVINMNSTLRMKYPLAKDFIGKEEFATLEILKIKNVINYDEKSLIILLGGVEELKLADNARLTIDIAEMELGLRRACIAIVQNSIANKITRKIDARYNSTATE